MSFTSAMQSLPLVFHSIVSDILYSFSHDDLETFTITLTFLKIISNFVIIKLQAHSKMSDLLLEYKPQVFAKSQTWKYMLHEK